MNSGYFELSTVRFHLYWYLHSLILLYCHGYKASDTKHCLPILPSCFHRIFYTVKWPQNLHPRPHLNPSKIFYFFDAYACSAHVQNFHQGCCSSMYFWTIYINLTFIAPLTGRKSTCRHMLFFTMNLITFLILAHPLLSRLVDNETTVVNTYVFIICND